MLDGKGGFVPLPSERIIHKTTPRVTLAITTPTTYPGNNPLAIQCNSGTVYLTNQRVGASTTRCSNRPMLTSPTDCVSPRETDPRAQVIFSSAPQPPRYTHDCTMVWAERVAGSFATRARWQHSRYTSRHRTEADIQGRRRA